MPQSSRLEAYVVRYARWLVQNPWLVLLLSALMVGALAAGAKNLKFSTDYRVYFGPENPQLLAFDELQNEDDSVMEKNGVKLLIDPMSYQYLVGAEIDYTEGLEGAQFVIKNPNAQSTCGCGSSFSV